jgi:type I restriction-modification system DNA methylase subunit
LDPVNALSYKEIRIKIASNNNGSMPEQLKELWLAAVSLRGSIEAADYKRYVLSIIFLRFLSMRYEKRRRELEKIEMLLNDPDEYRRCVDR